MKLHSIAISGTYCTGKTTLSLALSHLTGVDCTHAPTMREILPLMYPSKTLRDCNYAELLTLGMVRFLERVNSESRMTGPFISDGCPLQEWVYGATRLETGAYPDETAEAFVRRQGNDGVLLNTFHRHLNHFGRLAKEYARRHYDLFIHLPVEFDFVPDGHRPTSEAFRLRSEELLLQTYEDLEIFPVIACGSLEKRLETIVDIIGVSTCMDISTAIAHAESDRQTMFDDIALENPGVSPTPAPPPII